MRRVAADGTAFGFDDHVGEAATVIDAAISLVHRVVALVELREIGVDAISIFHEELTGADDAEPGPRLIAELGLDLVERNWKLLVRSDEVANQIGDDLFVGGLRVPSGGCR